MSIDVIYAKLHVTRVSRNYEQRLGMRGQKEIHLKL